MHKQDDRVGQRVATAELLELGLATQRVTPSRKSAKVHLKGLALFVFTDEVAHVFAWHAKAALVGAFITVR